MTTLLARRTFLALAAGAAAATAAGTRRPAPAAGPRLEDAGLEDLARGMASGRWTSEAVTRHYLARIRTVDRQLHAVVEVNPDALELARSLDRERKARGPRGPLHGIPVLLKENIDTADRMLTTAGSLALVDAPPPARDAHLVSRLREAGAVILGKTNLSEWANLRSTHSVSGWSGRGGLTRNPYALDRNCSGSSSGSGAAAAAGLCAAAVGTETDGSIISPASICGLVGLKPTVGLVSRAGIIPLSHTQDTAGPMARSVRDAALLLSALAGPDPRDPATAGAKAHPDYTAFLDADGLRGARLGVVRNFFPETRAMRPAVDATLKALADRGAVLVDPLDLPTADYEKAELEVLLTEFKADLAAYLGARCPRHTVRDMETLIAFNETHRDREMPWFGQELLLQAQAKGGLDDPAYLKALETCRTLSRRGIDALMDQHRLDALIAPSGTPAWTIDLVNGDSAGMGCYTPAAVAGYPHLTVPAGLAAGLPVGLSFFGRAWSEGVLLKLGYAFEQATRARRRPKLPPTLRA